MIPGPLPVPCVSSLVQLGAQNCDHLPPPTHTFLKRRFPTDFEKHTHTPPKVTTFWCITPKVEKSLKKCENAPCWHEPDVPERYRRVCEVWNQGQMPTEWTATSISLLYKKGDPKDASNYHPLAVSTCMYQITTKLILRRIKKPLTEVLSEHQAGGQRGHTTLSQAIKLLSPALSMPGTPDVVLLDIAKAFPSTPHPLLWAAMQQVGVPDRYISMMQYTYQETRC